MALTVNGARALHDLIVHARPHHIDLWLRAQLEEHAETLGCCYVNPPMGSYEEHVSGCEPSVGLRKRGFNEKWSREGTRLPKNEQRWLIPHRCKKTDPLRWVTDVGQVTAPTAQYSRADLIRNKAAQQSHHPLDWFTQWPPPFDSTDETLRRLLAPRG